MKKSRCKHKWEYFEGKEKGKDIFRCEKCGLSKWVVGLPSIEEVQNEEKGVSDKEFNEFYSFEKPKIHFLIELYKIAKIKSEDFKDGKIEELTDKLIEEIKKASIPTPTQSEKEWKEEGIGERRTKITQAINEANEYSVIPMSEDIIIHLTDNLMGVFNQSIQSLLSQKDKEIENKINERLEINWKGIEMCRNALDKENYKIFFNPTKEYVEKELHEKFIQREVLKDILALFKPTK
jgi:hypothetical protein